MSPAQAEQVGEFTVRGTRATVEECDGAYVVHLHPGLGVHVSSGMRRLAVQMAATRGWEGATCPVPAKAESRHFTPLERGRPAERTPCLEWADRVRSTTHAGDVTCLECKRSEDYKAARRKR